MSKSPRVTFKYKRVAEGDWQIEAHCPGVDIRFISGFKSKADVDDWLQGNRHLEWLRSQGYAKKRKDRAPVEKEPEGPASE